MAGLRTLRDPAAVLLLALLVLGLWLRCAQLEWFPFGDESIDLLALAWRRAHGLDLAFGVTASNGLEMPGGFLALLALPLALTHEPLAIVGLFALANGLGCVLLALAARRALGAWPAVALAGWSAALPTLLVHARAIWAPAALFPLLALFLWALAANFERYRLRHTLLAASAWALACHVHPTCWYLSLGLLAWLVLARPGWPRRDLVLGAGLVALTFVPWFAHLAATGFDSPRAWLEARAELAGSGGGPAIGAADSLATLVGCLGAGDGSRWLSAQGAGALAHEGVLGWSAAADAVAGALVALALLGALVALGQRARSPRTALSGRESLRLLCALAIPALALPLLRANSPEHYFVALVPFLVWLAVDLAAVAAARLRAPAAVLAPFGLLVPGQVAFALACERFVERHPEQAQMHLGAPYALQRAAWRERSDRALDEALRAGEPDAAAEARFAALPRRVWSLAQDGAEFIARGELQLRREAGALVVRGATPRRLLLLPVRELEGARDLLLRLELDVPRAAPLVLFYGTHSQPGPARKQLRGARLAAGRQVVFVPLDADELDGRLWLSVGTWGWTIHAAELRAE